MKVNMLEAKNQLSRLVKSALAGEEVVIASNGQPLVKLVPATGQTHLRGWGKLRKLSTTIDGAFTPQLDDEIAARLEGQA